MHGAFSAQTRKTIKARIDIYELMKNTLEVLLDNDIMKQLEEGKDNPDKIRDFEELAKELSI